MATLTLTVDDSIVTDLAAAAIALYPSVVGSLTGLDAVKAVIVNRVVTDHATYAAQQAVANRDQTWQTELNNSIANMKGKIS